MGIHALMSFDLKTRICRAVVVFSTILTVHSQSAEIGFSTGVLTNLQISCSSAEDWLNADRWHSTSEILELHHVL